MPEIAVVARITTAEGKRDETLAVLARLVEAAEGEPGTLQYTLAADAKDPDVVWVTELYADQAALDAHSGSATMAEVGGSLGGLLAAAPELHFAQVSRRIGAPAEP
jgi:quinol monooxygenase YgiN